MNDNNNEIAIPVAKTVWYKNTALWINIVAIGVLILTTYFGIAVPAELQASIITVINLLLQAPSMSTTKARAENHNRAIRSRMIK